jgi:D-beta-D-heptose 7-phosphate kinase/D-beta-D-heptose 1-phosphate adenosyltransferase
MSAPQLLRFLPAFRRFRVAVIGDMTLDRYIFGRATRISPEAPVPVVVVEREVENPGCAANAARNILGLGGQVLAFGIVGNDPRGELLVTQLRKSGADCSGLVGVNDRPTIVKTRVIANNQQVVRIDREDTSPVAPDVQDALEQALLARIRAGDVQAVIFEDYAKGVLSQPMMQRLTDAANATGIITVLDPHPSHHAPVKGLHVMKPNRSEAFGLAGMYYRGGVFPIAKDSALQEVARKLHHQWRVRQLLITLGGDGLALFTENDPPLHLPTQAREVFDVSGAGDCVTATYTLALLAGATPGEAARISNYAAGVVVAKIGTVPVTAQELENALRSSSAED